MVQTSQYEKTSKHHCDNVQFDDTSTSYVAPEVVGVLPTVRELESAIDDLLLSGFDRQQISVLGSRCMEGENSATPATGEKIRYLEDDPRLHLSAFVSSDSRAEFEAAAIGVPSYALGVGGLVAVIASGGSLAFALPALLLAGGAGAGLGALVARTISRHHRDAVAAQIAAGGLLLWVSVRNLAQENKAIRVLNAHHGRHVHVHEIQRKWGIEDVPLHDAQPDPFL